MYSHFRKIILFLFLIVSMSGCSIVGETLSTGYISIKDDVSSVKNYVSKKIDSAKSAISD